MSINTRSLTADYLRSCNRAQLRALFEEHLGVSTGPWASQLFLRGNLVWASSAKQEKIKPALFHIRLMKQLEKAVASTSSSHQPGTKLIREWHGEVYEVTILDKGYRWQGKTYHSLSRIASEITGTKWSGPRFFGLKETPE